MSAESSHLSEWDHDYADKLCQEYRAAGLLAITGLFGVTEYKNPLYYAVVASAEQPLETHVPSEIISTTDCYQAEDHQAFIKDWTEQYGESDSDNPLDWGSILYHPTFVFDESISRAVWEAFKLHEQLRTQ